MKFNPNTARNEMENFWELVFNPNAVSKFLHTISSGYVLASIFVIGISAWYLLKKRNILFAKRSIIVAASFGLITSLFLLTTGDESAYEVAQNQPMKLAAMEGLYKGEQRAGIIAVGLLDSEKKPGDEKEPFLFSLEIPNALSFLGYHSLDAFVPGVEDLLYGNKTQNIMSVSEKIKEGKLAVAALNNYKKLQKQKDITGAKKALKEFRKHEKYLGYGYLKKPSDAIPDIALTFYSFHTMVALGTWFLILFINGSAGIFLIGVALATLYSGGNFVVNEMFLSHWTKTSYGLEALLNPFNIAFGLMLVFLSRIQAALYLFNNINHQEISQRTLKTLKINTLLFILGINHTVYYPSLADLQSSLTIENSSGSHYTLFVMSIVSLLVPVVLGYVFMVWKSMDQEQLTIEEVKSDAHHY